MEFILETTDGLWISRSQFLSWLLYRNLCLDSGGLWNSISTRYYGLETMVLMMLCLLGNQKTVVTFSTYCSEYVKMMSTHLEWSVYSMHLNKFIFSHLLKANCFPARQEPALILLRHRFHDLVLIGSPIIPTFLSL